MQPDRLKNPLFRLCGIPIVLDPNLEPDEFYTQQEHTEYLMSLEDQSALLQAKHQIVYIRPQSTQVRRLRLYVGRAVWDTLLSHVQEQRENQTESKQE